MVLWMFKRNYFVYALIILIGFTVGFFALSNLYLNHGNEPVSSGPILVWKGNGTGDYVSISATYYNASVLEYDVLRSALKDRFGEAFIEVGFSYEGWHNKHAWNEWVIIFKEISLKVDDIEYIRSYFPRTYVIEIWTGVKNATIMVMKPPIIENFM